MQTIINYAVQLGMNFFEVYIVYRYMTVFFDNRCMHRKLTITAYLCRCVLSAVLTFSEVSPLESAALSIVSLFLISLCYVGNIPKKISITIVVYMCAFTAEAVTAFMIGVSGFNPLGQTVQKNIFSGVIIQLIFWAITLVVQRFRNIRGNTPLPKAFIMAIIIIPASSIYLELMIFKQQEVDSTMAGISLVCILASNIILIYLYDSLSKMFEDRTQAAIVSREKEYYHEQAEMLKRRHEEMKQFRHDMKNRMMVIQEMLLKKQYDSVLEYTKKAAGKIDRKEMYSMTGNIAIDSVINYKLTRAGEKGIDVKANVVLPENIAVDEDDMVVILGNILDNAIEAAERLEENKYIGIDLGYDKGSVLIHVENSYDSFVNLVNGKFVTRKKDNHLHGIGLQSVDAVVKKYDGMLETEHDEEMFVVDILLYI